MIRVSKEEVEVSGSKVVIMAELTGLIGSLKKCGGFTDEDIELCVETASMSLEDMSKKMDEGLKDLDRIMKELKDLL